MPSVRPRWPSQRPRAADPWRVRPARPAPTIVASWVDGALQLWGWDGAHTALPAALHLEFARPAWPYSPLRHGHSSTVDVPLPDGRTVRPASVRIPGEHAASWLISVRPGVAIGDSVSWLVAVAVTARATVAAGLRHAVHPHRPRPARRPLGAPRRSRAGRHARRARRIDAADLPAHARRPDDRGRHPRRHGRRAGPQPPRRRGLATRAAHRPRPGHRGGPGRVPRPLVARSADQRERRRPSRRGARADHPLRAPPPSRAGRARRRAPGPPRRARGRLRRLGGPPRGRRRARPRPLVHGRGRVGRHTARRRAGRERVAGRGAGRGRDGARARAGRVRRGRRRAGDDPRTGRARARCRGRRAVPRAGAGRARSTRHRPHRPGTPRAGRRLRPWQGDAGTAVRPSRAVRARGGRRSGGWSSPTRTARPRCPRPSWPGPSRPAPRCCTPDGAGCASTRRRCAGPVAASRSTSATTSVVDAITLLRLAGDGDVDAEPGARLDVPTCSAGCPTSDCSRSTSPTGSAASCGRTSGGA